MKSKRPPEKAQRLYAHGLLCEDVRDEIAGSASYIGVFSGGIIVEQFPSAIIKLCLVAWVSWPIGDPSPKTIGTILILPDGTELGSGNTPIPTPPAPDSGDRRQMLTSMLRCTMVPATHEGTLRAYVDLDGRRYRVSSLKIAIRQGENHLVEK